MVPAFYCFQRWSDEEFGSHLFSRYKGMRQSSTLLRVCIFLHPYSLPRKSQGSDQGDLKVPFSWTKLQTGLLIHGPHLPFPRAFTLKIYNCIVFCLTAMLVNLLRSLLTILGPRECFSQNPENHLFEMWTSKQTVPLSPSPRGKRGANGHPLANKW